jgi:hypothetical protein
MARYRLDDEVICQATSMPGDAPSINPDKAPAWAIGSRFRVSAATGLPRSRDVRFSPENGQIAAPH